MSRTTYTPFDLLTNATSAVVIVSEYIAPDSMTTRKMWESGLFVLTNRELCCLTFQMRYASRPGKTHVRQAGDSGMVYLLVEVKLVARVME